MNAAPCPRESEPTTFLTQYHTAITALEASTREISTLDAKLRGLKRDIAFDLAVLAVRRQRMGVVGKKVMKSPNGPARERLHDKFDELHLEVRESEWLVECEQDKLREEVAETEERQERVDGEGRVMEGHRKAYAGNVACLDGWPGARVCASESDSEIDGFEDS